MRSLHDSLPRNDSSVAPTARSIPSGVIEGFYGPPWSDAERHTLLDWMARFGLTVYLSCPKDDPHHRATWREPYPRGEAERIASLVADCRKRRIDFVWGVGPGLDLRHADEADVAALLARFAELLRLSCRRFALLLDDIPAALDPADAARFGTLAAAQAHVANRAQAWIAANVPGGTLLLCPTPYCDRMAAAGLGGAGYLDTLGALLAPAIDVLWTGPEIIAPEITPDSLCCVTALLRRKPVIWDNFFADDYDGQRFFAGPYAGRPRDLRSAVRGVFLNPNNKLPLNFVPFHTFSSWLHGDGPWDPRAAFATALRDWLPAFKLLDAAPGHRAREPVSLADLTLLADCFYGPYQQGDGAVALLTGARGIMEKPPAAWGRAEEEALDAARRLKTVGYQLADLADRPPGDLDQGRTDPPPLPSSRSPHPGSRVSSSPACRFSWSHSTPPPQPSAWRRWGRRESSPRFSSPSSPSRCRLSWRGDAP
jgi:protein O-GlcNAcase / histone acetyltransferase